MTTLREAAQQALEALAVATNCLDGYYIPRGKTTLPEIEDAIAALRAALAEPVQEPAFHGFMSADGTRVDLCFTPGAPRADGVYATAYYTAPPKRPAEAVEENT